MRSVAWAISTNPPGGIMAVKKYFAWSVKKYHKWMWEVAGSASVCCADVVTMNSSVRWVHQPALMLAGFERGIRLLSGKTTCQCSWKKVPCGALLFGDLEGHCPRTLNLVNEVSFNLWWMFISLKKPLLSYSPNHTTKAVLSLLELDCRNCSSVTF